MTVITLRMIVALIGIIRPQPRMPLELYNAANVKVDGEDGRTCLECILSSSNKYHIQVCFMTVSANFSAQKIMSLNITSRNYFWTGFISSSETLRFLKFSSDYFFGQCSYSAFLVLLTALSALNCISVFTHSHPQSYNGGSACLTKFHILIRNSDHSYMHLEQYLAQDCFKTKNGARDQTTDLLITGTPLCHGIYIHSYHNFSYYCVSWSLYWVPVAQEQGRF